MTTSHLFIHIWRHLACYSSECDAAWRTPILWHCQIVWSNDRFYTRPDRGQLSSPMAEPVYDQMSIEARGASVNRISQIQMCWAGYKQLVLVLQRNYMHTIFIIYQFFFYLPECLDIFQKHKNRYVFKFSIKKFRTLGVEMLSKCVRLHNWEKHKACNQLWDRLKKQSLFVSL